MTLKYGAPILYRTPIWVPLLSDPEAKIKLQPLSYMTIMSLQESKYLVDNLDVIDYSSDYDLLLDAIVDTHNILGFQNNQQIISQLPLLDKTFILLIACSNVIGPLNLSSISPHPRRFIGSPMRKYSQYLVSQSKFVFQVFLILQ